MNAARWRLAGRLGLASGSLGLMIGAVIAYTRHPVTGQVFMIAGAVLLVFGTILIGTFNPPAGGSDAG